MPVVAFNGEKKAGVKYYIMSSKVRMTTKCLGLQDSTAIIHKEPAQSQRQDSGQATVQTD